MEYVLQRGSALLWAQRLKRVDEAGLRRAEKQERAEGSIKGRVKAAEVQSAKWSLSLLLVWFILALFTH